MLERCTEQARRMVFYARYEAVEYGASMIEPEHLLLGLIREDRDFLARYLPGEVTADAIRSRLEEATGMKKGASEFAELPLSRQARRVLALAQEEADALSRGQLGLRHLLLGLLRETGTVAAGVLRQSGLDLDDVRRGLG